MTVDDIVIVGSGPAGAAAAEALATNGYPVTILESGDRAPRAFRVQAKDVPVFKRAESPSSPLSFVAKNQPPEMWFHELAPGGLSNHWTGACPRFHPLDFSDGGRLGVEYEWPVSYADLEPYYRWAERLLRLRGQAADTRMLPGGLRARRAKIPDGWIPFKTAAAHRGHSVVPVPLAAGSGWEVSRSAAPFNSKDVIHSLVRHGKARLRVGLHAIRFHVDSSGQATAIEALDRTNGRTELLPCRGLILAAGALATCKILLQTDAAPLRDASGCGEGVLGAYVHDHIKDWMVVRVHHPLPKLSHPLYLSRADHAESAPMTGVGYVFSARTRPADRVTVHLPGRGNEFAFAGFGMTQPRRANRVRTLGTALDELGTPMLEIDVKFQDCDRTNLERSKHRVLDLLDDAGFGPEMLRMDPGSAPGEAVHWAGGARMSRTPEHGVCDGEGRVFGCRNVALADASVFPTSVEKNPTLTLMALAGRSALSLARALKTGQT